MVGVEDVRDRRVLDGLVDIDDVPDRRLPGRRWLFNERDLTAVEATGG